MTALPPPGRWAIGAEARAEGEALLAQARAQGMRTAWLGQEAGFLSNLNVLENLRLMHDWHEAHQQSFADDLQSALRLMQLEMPEWLFMRPAQLPDAQLLRARLLRVLLLRPDALVLSPAVLGLVADVLAEPLDTVFAQARLFLLADPQANWPAWPPRDILPASAEEYPE